MRTMTAPVAAQQGTRAENSIQNLLTGWFAAWRSAQAQRDLRDRLADMSDAMLLDIGVGEDEIYLVRQRMVFTPRAWLERHPATRHLLG